MTRQYPNRAKFTKEGKTLTIFLLGLLAGTFFFNLIGKAYLEELVVYKGIVSGKYESGALSCISLFGFILIKRGKRFLLLLGLELTAFYTLGWMLFSGYYGFSAGVCLSALIMQYGFWGMALFLCWLLPHYPVYIFMWTLITGKKGKLSDKKRLLSAVLLLLLGVFLESYVNGIFLQNVMSRFR